MEGKALKDIFQALLDCSYLDLIELVALFAFVCAVWALAPELAALFERVC